MPPFAFRCPSFALRCPSFTLSCPSDWTPWRPIQPGQTSLVSSVGPPSPQPWHHVWEMTSFLLDIVSAFWGSWDVFFSGQSLVIDGVFLTLLPYQEMRLVSRSVWRSEGHAVSHFKRLDCYRWMIGAWKCIITNFHTINGNRSSWILLDWVRYGSPWTSTYCNFRNLTEHYNKHMG